MTSCDGFLLCFSPNCPWLDPRETWNLVTLTANQTNSGAMTSQAGLQRPWDLTGLSQEREGRREAAASTCPGSAHLALLLSINWLKLRSKIEEIRFGRIMVLRSALTDWKVRKKQFKWERNWESNREKCVRVCALEKMCKSVRNRESMCVWEIERVWESRLMKLGAKMSWVTFLAKMRALRNIVKQWMSVEFLIFKF